MYSLKGKTALITGATAGIGEACAARFAEAGASVIIAGRRKERLSEVGMRLEKDYSVKVFSLVLDVSDKDDVREKIGGLPEDWRSIDILVNNAGMAKGVSKIAEGEPDDWDVMIDTNLKGVLFVTRAVLPEMLKKGSGHIINIGSIAGREVYVGGNVYCATKFAVQALTKALRMELLENKIRISTIDPGLVETEFSEVRFAGDKERAKQVYKGFTPLVGDDIADAVLYCATRPAHVNISEMIVLPSAQASVLQVHKEGL